MSNKTTSDSEQISSITIYKIALVKNSIQLIAKKQVQPAKQKVEIATKKFRQRNATIAKVVTKL